MMIDADIEDRRIRFEARKLAVESYIKVHVDRAAGARLLVASYFRLIFTLSLGTLAAIVTLGSAWARFGSTSNTGIGDPVAMALTLSTILTLIMSAVLAANGLRRAVGRSIRSVRDPLPKSGSMIDDSLRKEGVTENEIFGHVMDSMDEMSQSNDLNQVSFMPPLISYLVAMLCAIASILWLVL